MLFVQLFLIIIVILAVSVVFVIIIIIIIVFDIFIDFYCRQDVHCVGVGETGVAG